MEANLCKVCKKESYLKCARCKNAYYCGKDHQKAHWKEHKYSCLTYEILSDENMGRYLVAARNFKAGEIVLNEAPLVIGPSFLSPVVCLGCLNELDLHNSMECPNCGWPVCKGYECYKSPHHKPECEWTIEKYKTKIKISECNNISDLYQIIAPLRMLYMKYADKETFERKIATLEAHTDKRKNTPNEMLYEKNIVKVLQETYNLRNLFSEEDILNVCGILEINGHEMPLTEPSHVAIFSSASYIEHNCNPNCSKSFTDDGNIIIHSAVPIGKGERISICYTDALWGTIYRQKYLLETKYFQCLCDRCTDITEFETYISALNCQECKTGEIFPDSFISKLEDDWYCKTCKTKVTKENVFALLEEAATKLKTIVKSDIPELKKFIKIRSKILHENHQFITEAKIRLSQELGEIDEDGIKSISDDDLSFKISLCRDLFILIKRIAKAECRVLGILLFELARSFEERARREAISDSPKPEVVFKLLNEAKTYLEKTIEHLRYEPINMPEGQLLENAKSALKQINGVIKTKEEISKKGDKSNRIYNK